MAFNDPTDIQVVVRLVDKMSAEMVAMRQTVETQMKATTATAKSSFTEQGEYTQKQSMSCISSFIQIP